MRILATHRALFGDQTFGERGTHMLSEAEIVRVVEVFEAKHAKWALVGAHAMGLITEPRATLDFDFVVEGSKLDAVVKALTKQFGELDERDIGAAIQLRAIDVDLIRSTSHPLFQVALDQLRTIREWRVPRTEVLVVLKFLAAVSPRRDSDKRMQDVTDIARIYKRARTQLDRTLMVELAALVYPGAETEFGELLDKLERGDRISI
jgi:hypothetical protein